MKKAILLLGVALFACESNCLICHPKLKPLETNPHNKLYKYHHFLESCTKCHPNHPSKGEDECGADCFECHSRQKLIHSSIPQHRKLKTCTKCHKSQEVINQIISQPNENSWMNFNSR
jgi:hypothetical protein